MLPNTILTFNIQVLWSIFVSVMEEMSYLLFFAFSSYKKVLVFQVEKSKVRQYVTEE